MRKPVSEGFEQILYAGARKYPTVRGPLAGIFVLALTAYAVYYHLEKGAVLEMVAAVWLGSLLGFTGIGLGFMNVNRRGSFRFINAVVMTRAKRAPVDSWVHVAPLRALPIPVLISIVLFALGMVTAFIGALLQIFGVIPKLNPNGSWGAFALATLLAFALMVVSGYLAYLNVGRWWRNGRFGARPSGVALGRDTVSIRVPGREVEIPWRFIKDVSPTRVGSGQRQVPMIKLSLDPNAGVRGNVQMLEVDGYTVPTDALYSALRWYSARPERREELGRIEGQQRIEGWRRDAIAVGPLRGRGTA